MNKLIAIIGLTFLTSSAFALDKTMGDKSELYGSPLLEHKTPEQAHKVQKSVGDNYAGFGIGQPADHQDKWERVNGDDDVVGDS